MRLINRYFALSLISALALALGATNSAHATTLNFEDLSGFGVLPTNYAGLTWTNWNYYDGPQSPYNASSGVERIYNAAPAVPTIQFGQDVTFVGAWMAGFGFDQYFEGYNNGIKIFESAHIANDFAPFGQNFVLNWAGVDEIRIQSLVTGNHYIIDDVQYTASSVPDGGSTIAMLGLALTAVAGARRKFGI